LPFTQSETVFLGSSDCTSEAACPPTLSQACAMVWLMRPPCFANGVADCGHIRFQSWPVGNLRVPNDVESHLYHSSVHHGPDQPHCWRTSFKASRAPSTAKVAQIGRPKVRVNVIRSTAASRSDRMNGIPAPFQRPAHKSPAHTFQ